MKRIGFLYEKIYDYENLKLAHKNAQKGKTDYKDVIKVNENEEYYLLELQSQLKNKTFKNGKYHIFKKIDKGKEREIYSLPYFPDRILHHAILQVLEPIWKKILIKDTYQSIKGRGIHEGFRRVRKAIQSGDNYNCLKIDVKKFYPSINNEILKQIIRKKIKDPKLLWLLDLIIDSTKGVPIGNYLSQFFGNLFLAYFDHWMKEIKKIKHYFRYCDDIVILHHFKQLLHNLLHRMTDYLKIELKLILKTNYQIFPILKRRLDFLGFKFDHEKIYIRKNIALNFKQKVKSIIKNPNRHNLRNGIMSYYGWVKTSKSYNLWNKYFTKEIELSFA